MRTRFSQRGRTRELLLLWTLGLGKETILERKLLSSDKLSGNWWVVVLACAGKSHSGTKEQKRCDGHGPWGGFPAPPRQGAERVCCLAHSELFTVTLESSEDLFLDKILSCLLWRKILFIFLAVLGLSCNMWDLVPRPGIKPGPPELLVWRLSPWATREVWRNF